MNHSRYFSDTRRSPYPRRRRAPVPRSPSLGRSLPAITLLSPDGYQLSQGMAPRPLSPGAFRMMPPKSAKQKMSSFVILNETVDSPIVSRAPSPSGRVSPFRGHGFKSPTSSRPGSRAPSPKPPPTRRKSTIVPVEKIKPVHVDIGLPPKSPKRVIKTVQIKEFKPIIKPKPILVNKEKKITPKVKIVSNKKPVIMSTSNKNKDKKSPTAPVVVESSISVESTKTETSVEPPSTSEPDDPIIVSEEKPKVVEEPEKKKKEDQLIPCYQPDKCCVVPPTMASPTQTATSTTVVPSSSTGPSTTTAAVSRLSAISSAVSVSETLSKKALLRPAVQTRPKSGEVKKIETAIATIITVDEIIKSRTSSAASHHSQTIMSPTLSDRTRSSMITVRAASNGSLRNHEDTGEEISTTKLIRAEPDLEVLSPNNLVRQNVMEEPLWVDNNRLPNGDGVASTTQVPKTRCRRFFASLWQFVCSVFCCWKKLSCGRCRIKNCCKPCCKPSNCCKRDQSAPKRSWRCWNPFSCCTSNCCKKPCCGQIKCCKKPCCGKIKCCEGKQCCKRKKSDRKMCCAKPKCDCSCKACCTKMKNCCIGCGDKINSICRSLFCLNLACCQRCLKKCTCCHKLKCCRKGGCCSCCNPNIKREVKTKLDKKNSRTSNHSKQERAKLDPALVEHSSMMKAAIPVLPACPAWLCLFLNLFIPGSGTLLSGLLCLCFGKPRFSVNDSPQNRLSSFLVNTVIAVGQLFTIIFCLVGWGWSIWWGVIMVKLSRKQKRLRLAEKNQEAAPANAAQNHMDPEKR